ncbi:imidazole glycerol phosphate synthase subunit HisH [Parachitinimonas caeni]|uniref:Imidazole glycerol phosphate synthase subunit HisH n=1 Tax=Parachitinimonas caeni TaxID=3031301 RepID=A0ABT7DS39_9NEIS|nr:imidazole glycerol phosphate synthase subunit HisH [Parachitinimonas caeni]MDK2122887.1 imidazole glycerol phosphate synthase subunit HisH [Parachitinimonas caeni]
MNKIIIVEYGMCNVGSIVNMLKKVRVPCEVTADPDKVAAADKLILPGVGAFGAGMQNLHQRGLVPALKHAAQDRKIPILGICLGMQLLTQHSEEGGGEGLALIDAHTRRFDFSSLNLPRKLPIPHMGWNEVRPQQDSLLLRDVNETQRFYFVHTFHVVCHQQQDRLYTAEYGYEFDAGLQHDNIIGVQFHPEKSHRFGLQLLKNFAEAAC